MKKKLLLGMLCVTILSVAACGKSGMQNSAEKQQNSSATNDQDAKQLAQESEKLYQEFLDGKVKLYTEKRDIVRYDYSANEYVPYYGSNDGFTLDEFLQKIIEVENDKYTENVVKQVKYTSLDCGMDEIPELGLQVDFSMNGDDLYREYVIKNIDGKLQLCYQMETYYRSYEELGNAYGLILSGGSYSAYVHGEHEAIIDANGDYKIWYKSEINYGGLMDLDSRFNDAIVNLDMDMPESTYFEMYTFAESPMVYEGPEYEAYLQSWMYCPMRVYDRESNGVDFEANQKFFQSLFDKAGVKLYTEDEIRNMLGDRQKELGITDTIAEYSEINWTVLDR